MDMLFTFFIRTSHTSALVIGIFLLGLGLGSYVVHRFQDRISNYKKVLAWTQFTIGVYATAVFFNLYSILPRLTTLSLVALSSLLLLAPTVLLGSVFALTVGDNDGDEAGLLYSIDLFGAVLGSFSTGFVLIPLLGVKMTILSAAAASVLSGLVLTRRVKGAVTGITLLLLILVIAITNSSVMNDESFSSTITEGTNESFLGNESGNTTYRSNTPFGEIMLKRNWLFIDKIPQCSYEFTYESGRSERELSSLALSPVDARSVAVIGLGCGSTLDKAKELTDGRIDVIEINPTVARLTRQKTNVLDDTNTSLKLEDGFNYMRETESTYDSVIIDVPKPSIAYSSNLYTNDMFDHVKSRLRPNGTVSMWVPPCHDGSANQRLMEIVTDTLGTSFANVYKKQPVVVASDEDISSVATEVSTDDSSVNTLDNKLLEDFYTEECDWRRRDVFREEFSYAYE